MKVRIGRRRSQVDERSRVARSPESLALGPAFSEGEWDVPRHFNFTRDVVDVLAANPKRRALMFLGRDGVIEPRTFHQLSEVATRWAAILLERGVTAGDRVLVVAGATPEWIEAMLACLKIGAVSVPCPEKLSADALEVRMSSAGAGLILAARSVESAIADMPGEPDVVYLDERPWGPRDPLPAVAAADTESDDIAFILSTSGTERVPMGVAHTHGSTFAARVPTEHWLDAGPGDAVWSTSDTGNALAVWNTLVGPWSRGAEVVLHHGTFDPAERLDLIDRLDTTILCQSPADYAALTELRAFHRYRPRRLRRLVSTGDTLARDVIATYEEVWGMTIHEGYGQAETAVVVANGADAGFRPGSVGLPIAGHEVAVIDDQGNVLGPGVEGELGLRGRPPSLFSHYWGAPEETKAAFRGDWFVTGDIASTDEDGFIWLVGRTGDVITSRGRRFGPFEIEHALREHEAVAESAAVGIRDLERGGQFVRAFVVLRAGATPSEQLEAHLRHFVESSLPEYAVPREIEFMDRLPRTPSGNIRRAELRERQVAGRPLWESTQVAEPEPLLPAPQPEAKPPAEPAGFVVQEYFPQVPPVAEPVAEPAWPAEPEPVAHAEPVPLPPAKVVEPELTPEPPAPAAFVEPTPEPEPLPPAALVEPMPETQATYVQSESEPPAALVEPEPPAAFVETTPEPQATDVEPPAPEAGAAPPVVEPASAPEPQSIAAPEKEADVPEPAPDPAPEPVAFDEPVALEEPAPPPTAEPLAYGEPEHVPQVEPEPLAKLVPEPESALAWEPAPEPFEPPAREDEPQVVEPVAYVEPEPEAFAEPEPVATPEPERVTPPEPEAVVEPVPEVYEPAPEMYEPAAEAVEPTPDVYEPTPEVYEPAPEVYEPAPEVYEPPPVDTTPVFAVEPGPLEPTTVEPEPLIYEPPAEVLRPAAFQPSAPEDEEPLEPLPDYVVDPNARPGSHRVEEDGEKPDLSGLGLRPVSFNLERNERNEPDRATMPKRPRPTTPLPTDEKEKDRRSRSTGEPGDELGEVDWMGGLSTRLSAYSLAQDEEPAEDDDGRDDTD
jgi:acetyl-CoA synthetase/medium-chain acyl-CoA synthetase